MSRKAIPKELLDDKTVSKVGRTKVAQQQAATPVLEGSALECPSDMSAGAKKEWKRIIDLYRTCNINVLNDLDKATLKSYCVAVDQRDLLYKKWQKEGCELMVLQPTKNGIKTVPNPILRELDRYANTIRILAEELALTPVSRAAYGVRSAKAQKSAIEDFMGDE